MSGLNKYSEYDGLSKEELEELLRRDFEQNNDGDPDAALYIAQLLAEREEAECPGGQNAVDDAWKSFKESFILDESAVVGAKPTAQTTFSEVKTEKKTHLPLLRIALIAAVITVLLVGAACAAGALGWLPKWNASYFSFSSDKLAAERSSSVSVELEQALAAHNAPSYLVPTWLPEGYEQTAFTSEDMPSHQKMGCMFSNGSKDIYLQYILYDQEYQGQFNKNDVAPSAYRVNGLDHYIISNEDDYAAIWQNKNVECLLYGFVDYEDLVCAINSIY